MILNQYQIQPNFQGNLLKEGLKLPQKKFNEVAKLYAEQTKGMPDLFLLGYKDSTTASYSKDAIENCKPLATIETEILQNKFKDYSPIKIVKELVKIAKEFEASKKYDTLEKELDSLYADMNNIRTQLKNTSDPVEKNQLRISLKKIELDIDKKQEARDHVFDGNSYLKGWFFDNL